MLCYEIGKCPRCGSPLTGRLKQGQEGQKYFMMGSPVIYASDPGQYNCACALCGVQWVGSGKMVKKSRAEIKEMQNEWDKFIDARPEYTRDEEVEIAEELYHGISDKPVTSDVNGGGILKKLLVGTAKQTNKQGRGLVDDFFGMTNSKYYSWKDDIEDQLQDEDVEDIDSEDIDEEGIFNGEE